ncbi:MAG: hypothetical protein H7Y04_14110 [Verrucomicrobia bacterium]|nr:hypothetical protein [Cytophagales bacterium]
MKLKTGLMLIVAICMLYACQTQSKQVPIIGTWELIAATATEKDSTFSTFNPKLRIIKIINPTHFAFLNHDLGQGKDSASATFAAGGGDYTLVDSVYTEHLEYYIDRVWENNTFPFVVTVKNDTLIQKGVEKVEKLGIERLIVEKYKRVKK